MSREWSGDCAPSPPCKFLLPMVGRVKDEGGSKQILVTAQSIKSRSAYLVLSLQNLKRSVAVVNGQASSSHSVTIVVLESFRLGLGGRLMTLHLTWQVRMARFGKLARDTQERAEPRAHVSLVVPMASRVPDRRGVRRLSATSLPPLTQHGAQGAPVGIFLPHNRKR
jgi:hypothetical protein